MVLGVDFRVLGLGLTALGLEFRVLDGAGLAFGLGQGSLGLRGERVGLIGLKA